MSTETSVLTPSAAVRRGVSRQALLILALYSLAHFSIDLYSGAIGVLQPLLISKLSLTLTQAGLLGGVLAFSSSVTQPLYGYLSDRYRSRLFSCLAPAVAAVFICALAVAPSYGAGLLMAVLGGTGVSAFHPQGSSWAAAAFRTHRAKWMAVFISSGTLGIALSPALFSQWIVRLGFDTLLWAALPGVAVSLVMLGAVRPPHEISTAPVRPGFDWAPLRAVWRPLSILYGTVFVRSAVQVTYAQFLALYLHRERGYRLEDAALALTLYLTAGAVGGFVGGPLSDRFGLRRVIMLSFALSVPFILVFFITDSPAGILSLAAGGMILLFTIPVNVTAAQDLVPHQGAVVSALMMGFAWGTAGMIFIPLTGWFAELTSLHAAMAALLVFPVIGFVLTRRLPKEFGR
jgi:FSR family fosmidomycin resistance protein-like MFS transporter